MTYSIQDAVRDLRPVLDKAPVGAVDGEWIASTMQAGHSSQSGGYRKASGGYLNDDTVFDIIHDVVERLEAAQAEPFNTVVIRWTKSRFPFLKSRVIVETVFDESTVPLGPDDPIYEVVAVVRRDFWQAWGEVSEGFVAERAEANSYNQTKWFGPHRRVIAIRSTDKVILATDGLSTPWAGVPAKENGVGCELYLEMELESASPEEVSDWAHLLISLGDLVADGYRVADDVAKNQAILFCRLAPEFSPMSRIILSDHGKQMEGLPFGSIMAIRVTPISEADIAGLVLDDDFSAQAARETLAKRGDTV